jgi:hypothetical protein
MHAVCQTPSIGGSIAVSTMKTMHCHASEANYFLIPLFNDRCNDRCDDHQSAKPALVSVYRLAQVLTHLHSCRPDGFIGMRGWREDLRLRNDLKIRHAKCCIGYIEGHQIYAVGRVADSKSIE